MNENTKSIAFIAVTAAFVALAIYTTPEKIDPTSKGSQMGQALFETLSGSSEQKRDGQSSTLTCCRAVTSIFVHIASGD